MNDKSQLEAMSRKYKAEMMKLYSRSASPKSSATKPVPIPAPSIPAAGNSQVQSKPAPMPKINIPKSNGGAVSMPNATVPNSHGDNIPKSRFPSPDEILAAETGSIPKPKPMAASSTQDADGENNSSHIQGNYDFPESSSEPPASDEYNEDNVLRLPDEITTLKGRGILQVEVSTANDAIPISDAEVVITKATPDGDVLIKMLYTDISGKTPLVSLPAPEAVLSDEPQTAPESYSDYKISVYAKGFYAVPEITVPIFATVKSIQPVNLIPVVEGDE